MDGWGGDEMLTLCYLHFDLPHAHCLSTRPSLALSRTYLGQGLWQIVHPVEAEAGHDEVKRVLCKRQKLLVQHEAAVEVPRTAIKGVEHA